MKNKVSFFVCIFFSLLVILGNKGYLERAQRNESLSFIAWDTYGYYLYLPAFIIHQDPGLKGDWPEKLNEKYKPTATFYQVATFEDGRRTIIYNIGYSICYLPAFTIGHLVAIAGGYDADGMSAPYQIALLLGALLYNLAGIFLLRKLLLTYFNDSVVAASLSVIFWGTNLYVSAGLSLGMPHNLLFLTNCLYLIYVGKWFRDKQWKDACIAGLLLGLNTIIRPTELTLIVVPILWNLRKPALWKEQLNYFWLHKKDVIIFMCCVCACITIQFSYWIYTTRSFEFNFHAAQLSLLDPYTVKFLFSYKKGWLLYTPIMIIGIFSYYYIYKLKREMFWSFAVYTVLIIYALSSWECWWYAASYGQRPMVESYPFFAVAFGCLFDAVKNIESWKRFLLYGSLSVLILLNIFQTWQYIEGIIHPERMTKKYYWKVFGKTEVTEEDKKSLSLDQGVFIQKEFDGDVSKYDRKICYKNSYETDTALVSHSHVHGGIKAIHLDSTHQFSPAFSREYYDITNSEYIWLRASVWIYVADSVISKNTNAALVIYMESNGKINKYSTRELKDLDIKPMTWTEVHLDYLTQDIKHSDDKIIAYFWNMEGAEIYVDDMEIEMLEPISED